MLNRYKDSILVPTLPPNSIPAFCCFGFPGRGVRIVYTSYSVPFWGIIYLSSHLQAYLQQVQDLVILESIILQTLGKFIFL